MKQEATKDQRRGTLSFAKVLAGRRLLLLMLTLVIGVAAGTFTNQANSLHKIKKPGRGAVTNSEASSAAPQQKIEAELITIYPQGFVPREIRRPPGKFLIAIDNRSGIQEIELRLDHETGNRLRQVQVARKKVAWRDLVELPPGKYRLTEANHPDWVCRFEISPR